MILFVSRMAINFMNITTIFVDRYIFKNGTPMPIAN